MIFDLQPASPGTIELPGGFRFAAATAGIKASGKPDLALVEAPPGTAAAALFTSNRVVAAPVEVGRAFLAASRGRVRAVLVNSGNANCATGPSGSRACRRVCEAAGRLLNVPARQVFPSSTGIIGVPFPEQKVIASLPSLLQGREATEQKLHEFARAILTTDTREKIATTRFRAGKREVSVLGVAKGSGMIHPQLATMLVYVFTDIQAPPAVLGRVLRDACDQSFNLMSVDGDTSTNDTVLLLASGQSGVPLNDPIALKRFGRALGGVCRSLADQIVVDGEGVKHVIRLSVERARSREEALQVARTIAHSLLVKTAWAGADPNWGRMLAAVGYSGVPVDPRRVSIYIGGQMVCHNGMAYAFDKARAHQDLDRLESDIRIRLERGRSSAVFTTADLTAEYVRINADYST
jgi:glutamate N-acetyltransferase / amino-acid N-acetyltransferase